MNRLNLKVQDSNLIEQETWEGLTEIGAANEKLEKEVRKERFMLFTF